LFCLVLSHFEPFGVVMPFIQLNPEKFDELLSNLGWSYQEVSRQVEKSGQSLSVSAISSAAKGNPIHPKTGKLIADAIGVKVSEIKENRKIKTKVRKKGEPIAVK